MENEKNKILYSHFKRILKQDEWKTYADHVNELIKNHSDISVDYSKKGNSLDAQRQAWICEGLREALEAPEILIDYEESFKNKVSDKFCRFCGKLFHAD